MSNLSHRVLRHHQTDPAARRRAPRGPAFAAPGGEPEEAATFAGWLTSLPARLLLGLIWLYRRTLSPSLPAVFGPTCGCRFHPTCAVYAAEAVRRHGAAFGAWLAVRRVLKCHPLHPGGFDPVPPRHPVVRRVRLAAPAMSVCGPPISHPREPGRLG